MVRCRPSAVRNAVVRMWPGANSALTGCSAQNDRLTPVMTPPTSVVAHGEHAAECDCDERSASMTMASGVPWTSWAQRTSTIDKLRAMQAHFFATICASGVSSARVFHVVREMRRHSKCSVVAAGPRRFPGPSPGLHRTSLRWSRTSGLRCGRQPPAVRCPPRGLPPPPPPLCIRCSNVVGPGLRDAIDVNPELVQVGAVPRHRHRANIIMKPA